MALIYMPRAPQAVPRNRAGFVDQRELAAYLDDPAFARVPESEIVWGPRTATVVRYFGGSEANGRRIADEMDFAHTVGSGPATWIFTIASSARAHGETRQNSIAAIDHAAHGAAGAAKRWGRTLASEPKLVTDVGGGAILGKP